MTNEYGVASDSAAGKDGVAHQSGCILFITHAMFLKMIFLSFKYVIFRVSSVIQCFGSLMIVICLLVLFCQDDPFSSLDLPTAAHIFEDGILHFCLMKRKRTVVLVTHELHFLPFAHAVSMRLGRALCLCCCFC
jgi:hypothetical protein